MTWGKMDDKFHRNKKVRKLRRMPQGYAAIGLWTFWWSWCLDSPDLDGIIPDDELDDKERKLADMLAADLHEGRGLWVRVDGGYQIHDFHEYNPTKKQVEDKRSADRERIAAKRGATPRVATDSDASRGNVARDSEATLTRVASTRVPIPSHAQPNQEDPLTPTGGERPFGPEAGFSSAAGFEVREAWAEASQELRTAMPALTGQLFAGAVDFARQVAKLHQKPLREAARAIACAALALPERERTFAFTRLDPYAPQPEAGPERGTPEERLATALQQLQAALAKDSGSAESTRLAAKVRDLKAAKEASEERRYARR